jgi:hypothetical protein
MSEETNKAEIQLKQLEVKEKKAAIKKGKREILNEESKTEIEKINSLRWLLESITIDTEKTILGSEPILKHTLTEQESDFVWQKIIELVGKL